MRPIRYLLVLPALLAVGCAGTRADLLPHWTELGDAERAWFSDHLRAAREGPLEAPAGGSSHRFLWLRAFHQPVVIRVDCTAACTLTLKLLSGRGGHDPGGLLRDRSSPLDEVARARLEALLDEAAFWEGPPAVKIVGLDGAEWVLEGTDGERYVAWDAWSPTTTAEFAAYARLCDYLIELSGLEIAPNAYY
jgi:hypothetical protein